MLRKKVDEPTKAIWTYAYEIVPAQAEARLASIRTLLAGEHADARREARTWVGRIVAGQHITHILVVSDSPDQNRAVNVRLVAELKALNLLVSLTAPLAVVDDREQPALAPTN